MKIIELRDHPANLDRSARLVAELRGIGGAVYHTNGGFVGVLPGCRCFDGYFDTQLQATLAVELDRI